LGLLVAVPALAVLLVLVKELLLTRTYGDTAMPSAPPG
jgi:predicted PurR-regulated permease PerM